MSAPITSVDALGRYLREYRTQQGLTQKDLGERFKLRPATVSALENGTAGVTLETLFQVMAALDLALYVEQRPAVIPTDNQALWS